VGGIDAGYTVDSVRPRTAEGFERSRLAVTKHGESSRVRREERRQIRWLLRLVLVYFAVKK
jgi:hypothetical protein